MSSKAYWAKRKRARMDEYHKDSDRVIGKVLEAYQGSIDDINKQMSNILKTFTASNKMSLEEAKQYLTISESKDFIENLKKTIDNVTDEELKAEMLRQINTPAYRARLTRLQAMKEKLNVECKTLADIQVREIEKGLINTAHSAYYKTLFDIQQRTGLGFCFAEIPSNQIEEILKNNWSGKHFSKRIWKNSDMLASELEHTLTKGFMTGASIQKMSKEIADRMQIGEFAATRLIRTETTYVANMAEIEAYKESSVDKIMFLATLDIRTSDICRKYDEKIIALDEAVPGANIPPLHANCRSTTIEIFDDDNLENLQRRSRDPVTGKNKTVPADTNYKDWYKENVENNPRAVAEEKKIKNKASDKRLYDKYQEILGNEGPKSFEKFQELKYNNVNEWQDVKELYSYLKQNPNSDKTYYNVNKEIDKLKAEGIVNKDIGPAVKSIPVEYNTIHKHALKRMKQRNVTEDDAKLYVDRARVMFKQNNGDKNTYYSNEGSCSIVISEKLAVTVFPKSWYDDGAKSIMEVLDKYGL